MGAIFLNGQKQGKLVLNGIEYCGAGAGTGKPDFFELTSDTFDLTDETYPTSSETIPSYALYNNPRIRNVSLSSPTEIGEYAFYMTAATGFNFPNVETIGAYAFYQSRGANPLPINFPKVKTIGTESFRNSYFRTDVKNRMEVGTISENKPVGSTYDEIKTSNSQRGRISNLYPVIDDMKMIWNDPSIYSALICYFDSDQLYKGTYSSWDSSGEVTINKSSGDYIAVAFRKTTSPYYFYTSDWDHLDLRFSVNGAVIDEFKSQLELSECISIGDNAFRGSSNMNFYLPKVEHLGTCWGWDGCNNYNLILPSIKTMANQPFRGVSFTNLVLGSNWTSCGSGFGGYDADWRGRYVYIYATTPPTMGGGLSIQNGPVAIYVPAESVTDYQTASQWSTKASIIQALPSDHLTIDTWL